MIKIVPDANIILSGMIGHYKGNSRKLLNLALEKRIVMYGSSETYKEFCEKIRMSRIQKYLRARLFTPEKIILDYKSLINIIEPFDILKNINIVTRDPDDDIYFRVAKSCGARIIATGDKGVLSVKKYDNIVVVTVSDFIGSFSKLYQG
ncbi:MAG: putative toxin-antitoxin system toxin component, PIN family [Candidatus Moranbacteria bacterium RIFOXYC1_FULL_44_13]|nr:MAG: putative toxin-antitoxin system toxin component, PIN family [Candidatus Moranbacteria bacterium RIFOXYC1_FULL_44_13]OGI37113.1 MAG: putative toxin-antitoxin system toxin component, PIN family [Candidatus Moranbacteria bacterium RIFOXYD1_FULL_44_12]